MRKSYRLLALVILSLGLFEGGCRNKKKDAAGDASCEAQALALTKAPLYYFVFPERLPDYESGSLVLQPKTGRVYRCKPHPYSAYCAQWSPASTRFEPGVGSNWMAAWDLQ